ncbi:MAG: hypothetical protein HY902_05360, partial [Deltaproteobacteria bacterium]|nr:hypothetical protein [Deltaproteobacteria bacterium]
SLTAVWRRRWWWPFAKTLRTQLPAGKSANPTYIPVGNQVARRLADKTRGVPMSAINEVLLDVPTTAHILGGCSIGPAGRGVVDAQQRVHGYQGLRVCDGSVIPANLGVNPSLTITALAEHAMESVPVRQQVAPPAMAAAVPVWGEATPASGSDAAPVPATA